MKLNLYRSQEQRDVKKPKPAPFKPPPLASDKIDIKVDRDNRDRDRDRDRERERDRDRERERDRDRDRDRERDRERDRDRDSRSKDTSKDFNDTYDSDDPTSTNLYVGNISSNVTEEILYREFGKYGPIGSIKIMWPRSEDEKKRGRMCGFVAFMERDHAEKARDGLQGVYYDYAACPSLLTYSMKVLI